MPHLTSYLLVSFALSALTTASPLRNYVRDTSAVPSNVAPGTITAGCTLFHSVGGGETCGTIESEFNIPDATFHTFNPEVNSICSNLIVGSAYCVQTNSSTPPPPPTSTSPPSNVANGTIIDGCTQFFTIPPGMTCLEVETTFNISDAIFHTLNPEVNSDCTNLFAGEAYCVANSTTPSTIPGNLAAGTITAGCTQFFTVQLGDTCISVQSMFNINSTAFATANPEVNAECTNLIAGEAYCVGVSA